MKLKLRVEKKDFIYFILIALVLLLGCFILAVNFISLSFDGELAGLNIIPNINGKSIILTVMLFVISLVIIFFNVSSTIFEFDKGGPGFTLKPKEEKGYNRWLTDKEMKSAWQIKKIPVKGKADAAGIVFINDGKNMWVDNGEYHTLIIGMSGSGKTTALVDPQVRTLIRNNESIVVSDPKGEIYRDHGNHLKACGYNVVVINFREPTTGNSWNPLTVPYNMYKQGKKDKAKELLEDISQNILISKESQNDPFWETSAADYFNAFALSLFEDASENEVNISSISRMVSDGEVKNGMRSTFAKDFFELKGTESAIYQYAKGTILAPDDTRSSILSVAQSKLRTFASREELSEMLSFTDFSMEDVGRQKTAVFLIVHDEKKTYHPLATIFIKQLYEVLIDVAHKNPEGYLKYRTNFILDEFANMPELKDVDAMVTAARSRHIRFTFIIQNFSQLDDVYGEKKAETIRSNCGNLVYLLTNELAALEKISKLCGEVKSKEKEKTVSTPLVTVTDLQKMKRNEIIVIRMRQRPFRTVLKAGFDVDWGESYEKATVSSRDVRPLKTFDIKEYVKVHKKAQTPKQPSSPFGDPFKQPSPFGGPFKQSSQLGSPDLFKNDNKPKDDYKNNLMDDKSLDDLIKNIDKQIAMLEEEQKQEEANKNKTKAEKNLDKTDVFDLDSFLNNNTNSEKLNKKEEEEVFTLDNPLNVDKTGVVLDKKIVTDDEYFDDFFGEDDFL